MITNLHVLDEETAVVFGQRFDLDLVLDAAETFLRSFVRDIVAAEPAVTPTLRLTGDRDRTDALDDAAYRRMRQTFGLIKTVLDVDTFYANVAVDPFRIHFYALGGDTLQRKGPKIVLPPDQDWMDLNPTPHLQITPANGDRVLFGRRGKAILDDLLRRHAPPGTAVVTHQEEAGQLPGLRFPHARFGCGLGDLRIALRPALDSVP